MFRLFILFLLLCQYFIVSFPMNYDNQLNQVVGVHSSSIETKYIPSNPIDFLIYFDLNIKKKHTNNKQSPENIHHQIIRQQQPFVFIVALYQNPCFLLFHYANKQPNQPTDAWSETLMMVGNVMRCVDIETTVIRR